MRKCWRSTSLCLDAHRLSERLIGLWLLTSCEISRAVRAQPNLIYNTPLLGLGKILHFLSFFGSLCSFGLLFQTLIIYVHQFVLPDFALRLCEYGINIILIMQFQRVSYPYTESLMINIHFHTPHFWSDSVPRCWGYRKKILNRWSYFANKLNNRTAYTGRTQMVHFACGPKSQGARLPVPQVPVGCEHYRSLARNQSSC